MALDIVVQSLLTVELFAGLKPRQLAEIARRSDRIVYRPGQAIITDGEAGDAAVLVVKGDAVRLGDGPDQPAQQVPEGALVGELAMLIETVHSATVVSRGVTRAIRIKRDEIREQIADDPDVALLLSNNLARRLTGVAAQLRAIDDALARSYDFGPIPTFSMAHAAIEAQPLH
jgi:CRP-like cAMP-binding protein